MTDREISEERLRVLLQYDETPSMSEIDELVRVYRAAQRAEPTPAVAAAGADELIAATRRRLNSLLDDLTGDLKLMRAQPAAAAMAKLREAFKKLNAAPTWAVVAERHAVLTAVSALLKADAAARELVKEADDAR